MMEGKRVECVGGGVHIHMFMLCADREENE